IMTTDGFPKVRSARVGEGRIVGIAKGAGMIEPNMATMLVFLMTDIPVKAEDLNASCRETAEATFNTITVDGDQSTSDMMLLFSSGLGEPVPWEDFTRALMTVCRDLSEDIVRNGEGTSHVIRVSVEGAPDKASAKGVAKAVVNSPLVKTAVFGNDPNLGRIIMAVGSYAGNTGLALCPGDVSVSLGGVRVFHGGCFHLDKEREAELSAYLKNAALPEVSPGYPVHDRLVEIHIDLSSGKGTAEVLGSDLSYQYVRENADYRT
ncbi:MAG: bifunctional ornithine acetyltransferase/N-acetylglutamate synthase, partial [Spirochaetales bacterium]|nr:bifunctional ornithine acetyltransferase/N-acetylglutamate synthase [Spirochaetales bacterium]